MEDTSSDWYPLRIRRLKSMSKTLLIMLLIIGLQTALESHTICMIAPSRFGCALDAPEQAAPDYGLVYCTAYAISYILGCIFLPIIVPFAEAWANAMPASSDNPDVSPLTKMASRSTITSIDNALISLNRFGLGAIVLCLGASFLFDLCGVLRFRDGRWATSYDGPRTSWGERFFFMVSVGTVVSIVDRALRTLDRVDFAHVKVFEFLVLILPALILVVLRLASLAQRLIERRMIVAKRK